MENEVQVSVPKRHSNRKLFTLLVIGLILGIAGGLFYITTMVRTSQKIVPPQEETATHMSVSPTMMPREMTVTLNQQHTSGESGTALLREMDGKVTVIITLKGAKSGSNQPAHIHTGYCPNNVGAIKYPLSNVVDGKSETVLNTTFDTLKKELPLAINVHKSQTESSVYTSCGDLFSE